MAKAKYYVVTITFDKGLFSYSCSDGTDTQAGRLHKIKREDGDNTLEWTCASHNWAIHFDSKTPLKEHQYRGVAGAAKGDKVRANSRLEPYKYWVAVADPKTGDVYIDDPEADIEP